jgi:hypothetical protein
LSNKKEWLMGFWNAVGKIANEGLEKARETGAEAQDKYSKYDRLSDEQLLRRWKSGNMTDRMAAGKLLKERGYGPKD